VLGDDAEWLLRRVFGGFGGFTLSKLRGALDAALFAFVPG
jgi:hypothetical protein